MHTREHTKTHKKKKRVNKVGVSNDGLLVNATDDRRGTEGALATKNGWNAIYPTRVIFEKSNIVSHHS